MKIKEKRKEKREEKEKENQKKKEKNFKRKRIYKKNQKEKSKRNWLLPTTKAIQKAKFMMSIVAIWCGETCWSEAIRNLVREIRKRNKKEK